LEVYFQSATTTTKNEQITVNLNVAFSNGSFRLEGTARDIGRPLEHSFFTRVFAETHQDAFKQYSPRSVTRLFAVRPRLATIWKLDPDSGPHEILVDLESRTVRRNPLLTLEEWRGLSAVGG
jgi:hypothetical protein